MDNWPIHITVAGRAAPAGSKTAFIATSNDLRTALAGAKTPAEVSALLKQQKAIVTDANEKAAPWKETVAWRAAEYWRNRPLLDCPLDVQIVFTRLRPKAHFGTGRNAAILKEDAPLQPTGSPDVLKLARGVEDALTGIVYRDDALIVNEYLQKRYGDREQVDIYLRPTARTCVRDLLLLGEERTPAPSDLIPQAQLTLV